MGGTTAVTGNLRIARPMDRGRHHWAASAVVLVAFLIRYAAWLKLGGPIRGEDSRTYLAFAAAIARGDFTEMARLPFYVLYPLTLAPLYVLSLPESTYLLWLHLVASTLTVFLIYRIGTELVSQAAGLLAAAVAAVYPAFLFWLPYILTETLFLLCLAAYADAYLRVLGRPRPATVAYYAAAFGLFIVSRPSATPCVVFSWTVMAACVATRRWGVVRGLATVGAIATAVVVAAVVVVGLSASLRDRLLSMPTIGQTLWASTQYSTGTLPELQRIEQIDQEIHTRFRGQGAERREYAYKVREAGQFIARHPARYLGMAGRKLVAFWYPWAFADTWSLSHRAVDAVVSIALSIGFLLTLARQSIDRWRWAGLLSMAAAFALLSAFGQIDPDARYRLPAELIVIVLASAGYASYWSTYRDRIS